MAQWFESDRRLYEKEKRSIASAYPLLRIAVFDPGFQVNRATRLMERSALVHGVIDVADEKGQFLTEYGIVLLIPVTYPRQWPILYGNDAKLPIGDIDRHMLSSGQACLAVDSDIVARWSPAIGIAGFLRELVEPFLVWQAYYDQFGVPPPWGERPHGKTGIVQYYGDMLSFEDPNIIIAFMRLLARKNSPKGHERCPCGSGLRLRSCHRNLLYSLRSQINPQAVQNDLKLIETIDSHRGNI
jgi:hypothetical protein